MNTAWVLTGAGIRRPFARVAGAVAIRGDRVLAVGTVAEALDAAGPGALRVHVPGGVVLPGLVDSHCHLLGLAQMLGAARLVGAKSLDEVVARTVEHARGLADGAFIEGGGWDQNIWQNKDLPTHEALSWATPDRPCALYRIDGHALLVNRAALDMAGIGAATGDPAGGRILRDATGEPTGVLLDNAMRLVLDRVPTVAPERRAVLLDAALAMLARLGITFVHDMGLVDADVALLRSVHAAGRLTARVHAYLLAEGPGARERLSAPRIATVDGLLSVGGAKLYLDGALGSRGAALHEPYDDVPLERGLLLHEPDELAERVRECAALGHQVAVHAIGDRAADVALDVFEAVGAEGRLWAPRIEHAQMMGPSALARAARLGVLLAMQPAHGVSDSGWVGHRLGQRADGAYAWGEALRRGCRVALGSDFPVEDPSPLRGLLAATGHHEGWDPGPLRRLTPDQALYAATVEGGAFAGRSDVGALAPGMAADLTVLDVDPVADPAGLARARVLLTVVGGRVVHDPLGAI